MPWIWIIDSVLNCELRLTREGGQEPILCFIFFFSDPLREEILDSLLVPEKAC